jgi:hypothetical protein
LTFLKVRHQIGLVAKAWRATRHNQPWYPHWIAPLPTASSLEEVVEQLGDMARADWSRPAIKGHPDTAAIRRMFAVETKRALETRSISEAVAARVWQMKCGTNVWLLHQVVALVTEALQCWENT